MTQVARAESGAPVIANGGLDNPDLAASLLNGGQADFVSIARAAIANPDWPRRVRIGEAPQAFQPGMIHPQATIEHTARWAPSFPASRCLQGVP